MLHVNVVTPDKIFLQEDCINLIVPTLKGEVQILSAHANLLSQVIPGIITLASASGQEKQFMIGEGFLEVLENRVEVICDIARLKSEIDFAQEHQLFDSLSEELKNIDKDSHDFKRISGALQKSIASLKLED